MSAAAATVRALATQVFRGRRLVLAGPSAAALVHAARQLHELGALESLVVTSSSPPGASEGHVSATWCRLRLEGGRAARAEALLRAIERPDPRVQAALERFDPGREAWLLDSPLVTSGRAAGRRRYGWRRRAWARWEDKTRVDALWRAARIDAPQQAIVAVGDRAAAWRAACTLDAGAGTVWACDATHGLTTGAEGLRWVRDRGEAERAAAAFAGRARLLRITPFVEGVPCSLHGMVLNDDVVTFRPLELVTLRDVAAGRFRFAGTSTHWDCPPPLARALHRAARAAGDVLRGRGYRGGFTIDGIGTRDGGFAPTELNARLGSGLVPRRTMPELPLYLLDRMVQEGERLPLPAAALERDVRAALARRRVAALELDAVPAAACEPKGEWEPGALVAPRLAEALRRLGIAVEAAPAPWLAGAPTPR